MSLTMTPDSRAFSRTESGVIIHQFHGNTYRLYQRAASSAPFFVRYKPRSIMTPSNLPVTRL